MKRLITFLFIVLLLFGSLNIFVSAQDNVEEETYYILYDQAHNQSITSQYMNTALSSLEDALDTEDLDVTIELVVNEEQFTSASLQGYDLVIISNPGPFDDSYALGSEEEALNSYVELGGSVLYMSNPFSTNSTITGHAEVLNELLVDVPFEIEVGDPDNLADRDNTTILVDDFNNVGEETHVIVSPENINDPVLYSEVNNISASQNPQFLYYGTNIILDSGATADLSGNSSKFAYTIDQNYAVRGLQNSPLWLAAENFPGTQGRAMVIGSTIMFSDIQYDSSTNWIDQFHNLALFQNIVGWLMEITPFPEEVPIVTEPFSFFIRSDLLAALIISASVLLISLGYYIRRGRISTTEILDVFEKKKGEKSKDKKSKESKPKKKKRKRTKRERRKRT